MPICVHAHVHSNACRVWKGVTGFSEQELEAVMIDPAKLTLRIKSKMRIIINK